jgi:hypothetical protein
MHCNDPGKVGCEIRCGQEDMIQQHTIRKHINGSQSLETTSGVVVTQKRKALGDSTGTL